MSAPLALPLTLAAPFAGAIALIVFSLRAGGLDASARLRISARLAGGFVAVAAVALLALAPTVIDGRIYRAGVTWLPSFGVGLGLRLDALALLFAGLILGIGLLVVLYARYYLSARDPAPWFYALILAFMGSMLGIALADNLILLAVSWELTSLTSFLLIGYWRHRGDARDGARMALTITGAGGLCLMAGLLMLGWMAGSWELDAVLRSGDTVRAHPAYPICLALILLGAFTKSAQFPFHFWLPQAMAAPTPASAYLHSATMVKAGIFLLARLYPVLSGTDEWFFAVTTIGAATLLTGAWHAIFQHDLKGLLAYSTISHLGLIVMLLGLSSEVAPVAALFHLCNHATFKASLFMAAGIIDHETGTRDMRRLSGLARSMPITATLAIVASAAMAGVPLLNGFLSKEMFFAETLAVEGSRVVKFLVPAVAAVAAALSVAYSVRFAHDVFFNDQRVDLPRQPHEPPHWMRVPVELLVVICLLVGLFPGLTIGPILAAGTRDLLGHAPPHYSLAIWHGLNLPLAMSAAALVAGVLLYVWLQRGNRRELHLRVDAVGLGKRSFERAMQALVSAARRFEQQMLAGGARRGLLLAVLVAVVAGAVPWLMGVAPTANIEGSPLAGITLVAAALWVIAVMSALATVWFSRERLVALIALGIVGLVVSLAFVWFSAPDLALTQILVEVATVMLMMLSLRYLPAQGAQDDREPRRLRDACIAGVAGTGLGAIAWAVMMRPFDSLSDFYLQRSLPEAGGTNAVNVVIVDFRGFDTFGEAMVMATAGLVIHDLVARLTLPPAAGPERALSSQQAEQRSPMMLSALSTVLLPLALMVSVYFFLRGHNLPGGGFIAGLITAIALLLRRANAPMPALSARADSRPQADSRSANRMHQLIGTGLLLTALTGLGSWLFGYPFLTSTFGHPVLPLVGELPLASAALFDLGVYLTVVGATVLALTGIGRLRRAG